MADELDLEEGISNLDGTLTEEPLEAAAEDDAWFRAEVRKAIKIADDPATVWISNEEAQRQSAVRRAEWLKRAELLEAGN